MVLHFAEAKLERQGNPKIKLIPSIGIISGIAPLLFRCVRQMMISFLVFMIQKSLKRTITVDKQT